MHNKLHRCRSCCLLLTVRPHWDTSDTHTHTPCTPAQQVSLCSLCSCGLFWNISICMPASDTPPFPLSLPRHDSHNCIMRCLLFLSGRHLRNLFASDSRAPRHDSCAAKYFNYTNRRCTQARGRVGGGVLLQGCCSCWGALRTVSPDMACNLYFELASVN